MLNRKCRQVSLLASVIAFLLALSGLTFVQPAQASTSRLLTTCSPACYFYAGYYQAPSPAPTDALVSMDVKRPVLHGDYHSLAEISVQSLNQQQTIEAGWTVDPALNGDNDPHFFIGSWKNGVFQGYNNANFTPCTLALCGATPAAVPGTNLSSYIGGTAPVFGITYSGGAYWVKFGSTWSGFINGSNWSGVSPAFTNIPLFKAFGEVAAVNTVPCAQMGDGVAGSTITGAARVGNLTYVGTTATASFTGNTVTNAAYYSTAYLSSTTTRSFAYGGTPPAC
jgi:hypothetical protein